MSCPDCEAPRGRCDSDCPSVQDLLDRRAEEDAADQLRRERWAERVRYEREDQWVHEPYEREVA